MIFSCSHVTVQRTAWLSSAPCNWVAWLDVIGEGPESPALFSGMDLRWEVLVVKLVCLFISSGYVISFSKPMTWSLYIASTLIGFAAAGECWIKHFPFGNLSISASLSHLTCIILSLYPSKYPPSNQKNMVSTPEFNPNPCCWLCGLCTSHSSDFLLFPKTYGVTG